MSQNYQQYNSNPYAQAEAGYGASNPYGDDGGYGQRPGGVSHCHCATIAIH